MLVAAVLGPEKREDGELEVVGVAAEELPDPARLPVGETEGAVERLFRDVRQAAQSNRGRGRQISPRGGGALPRRETRGPRDALQVLDAPP